MEWDILLEHKRSSSEEGWRTIVIVLAVSLSLFVASFIFEMGIVYRSIGIGLNLFVSTAGIIYAVRNIRAKNGMFVCRLTSKTFSQSIPEPTCGESFHIELSDILWIEIRESWGEGPSDKWYIHTKAGSYRIASNYGNPHRKFGEAIKKALPTIELVYTDED